MQTPRSTRPPPGQPVLVAVDGHTESLEAVAWAAAEAAARQTSLFLLHVYHWPFFWAPLSEVYPVIDPSVLLDDAQRLVETATEQARQVAPGVAVGTLVRTGDPARIITAEGQHACLVVLGRREDSYPTQPRRRSVTRHVIARSDRPVTLVGCNRLDDADPEGTPGADVPTGPASGQRYSRAPDLSDVRPEFDDRSEPLLRRQSTSAALLVLTTPGRRFGRPPSRPVLGRLLAMTLAPITFVRADVGRTDSTDPRRARPARRAATEGA